jgi:hypothetical protein
MPEVVRPGNTVSILGRGIPGLPRKNAVFWDVTLLQEATFEGMYGLSNQGEKISELQILVPAGVSSSLILSTLMIWQHVPPKRQFLQEPHSILHSHRRENLRSYIFDSYRTSTRAVAPRQLPHSQGNGVYLAGA